MTTGEPQICTHQRGPAFFVSETTLIFGCSVCGCLCWEWRDAGEPVPEREAVLYKAPPYVDDGQCNGITGKGARCKVLSAPGLSFCLTHQNQAKIP